MAQRISTPEILKVNTLPYGRSYNYAVSYAQNHATSLKRYINMETIEYYLTGIEVLLALRFLMEFFSGYSKGILLKIYDALTAPLVLPFSTILGNSYQGAIERFEFDTLLAMLLWGVTVWAAIGIVKYRNHTHSRLNS